MTNDNNKTSPRNCELIIDYRTGVATLEWESPLTFAGRIMYELVYTYMDQSHLVESKLNRMSLGLARQSPIIMQLHKLLKFANEFKCDLSMLNQPKYANHKIFQLRALVFNKDGYIVMSSQFVPIQVRPCSYFRAHDSLLQLLSWKSKEGDNDGDLFVKKQLQKADKEDKENDKQDEKEEKEKEKQKIQSYEMYVGLQLQRGCNNGNDNKIAKELNDSRLMYIWLVNHRPTPNTTYTVRWTEFGVSEKRSFIKCKEGSNISLWLYIWRLSFPLELTHYFSVEIVQEGSNERRKVKPLAAPEMKDDNKQWMWKGEHKTNVGNVMLLHGVADTLTLWGSPEPFIHEDELTHILKSILLQINKVMSLEVALTSLDLFMSKCPATNKDHICQAIVITFNNIIHQHRDSPCNWTHVAQVMFLLFFRLKFDPSNYAFKEENIVIFFLKKKKNKNNRIC
ncbi:hypothetical protein RFI_16009 [Reticulomyxa filosa]|uniref:Uncharacterized protein n=1 Tax=Reticulomyxa filosa TaxID=46433 RepID=X6N576_RETFI|nr:hypothetical protein RFI_16009 [Reticulomyxa filosa]|eukprot:ETO21196.1 hypothetical protein RFI_16009 [Reticulomyxa filosa]